MVNMFVYPYKTGSKSAKSIANALGITLLRKENSKFIGSPAKVVINWGASEATMAVQTSRVINVSQQVKKWSNKREFFSSIVNWNSDQNGDALVPIPKVFFAFQEAYSWWLSNHTPAHPIIIVARTILNGHSGAGIKLLQTQADFEMFSTPCNLFTVYIKKMSEFRLHFRDFSQWVPNNDPLKGGKVFFAQRKALRQDWTGDTNAKIRNLANGYVYVTDVNGGGLAVPPAVSAAANQYIRFNQGRLEFGALDIVYNKQYNKAYILEVNTAPGLSGQTIDKYAEQFNLLKAKLGV